MRVSMPAIIDQAGRKFNVDEADGVSRRDRTAGERSQLREPRHDAARGKLPWLTPQLVMPAIIDQAGRSLVVAEQTE